MDGIGRIRAKNGTVRWELEPGEARELADFIEEVTPDPKDVAHEDVADLRRAANDIDGREDAA